jgi:hypothetical protein
LLSIPCLAACHNFYHPAMTPLIHLFIWKKVKTVKNRIKIET